MPRTTQERSVIAEGASVKQKAQKLARCKEDDEKHVHKSPIDVSDTFVIMSVLSLHRRGRLNAKRAVKEAVNEDAEHSQSEPRLIHIVSAVHSGRSRKERRDKKARTEAKEDRQYNTNNIYIYAHNIDVNTKRVAEQKIADKGGECCGKHCNVQIFSQGIARGKAIQ